MSILPQGYANVLTPVFEVNQTPDSINVITTSGLAVATRVGNTVNINVPAFGAENLADTLTAGNSAGANQINMNSNKIINCLNPTDPQDVATKAYVDAYSPTADSLASVLAISNVVGATGINMNNTQRVYNCINPVNPQDVATKAYVDGAIVPTPTLKAVMNVGNQAGVALDMDGYDVNNAGSITAGGITEAINFGTLITPMLTNNQYATNVSINGINPLATATSISGVGGVSISSSLGDVSISCPLDKDLGISGGDVNITQIDPASVLNISSTGAMALVSGIGLDISATATVLINSSGNISIGSGNALGADVEVEKIAFKENKIYKAITVPVPSDIQIEDVASIVNVGDPIAINGSITNISAQTNGNVNISATGTGAVAVSAPTASITTSGNINLTTTGGTADITLTAEDAITQTCKGFYTAGSSLGLSELNGNNTNVRATNTLTLASTNGNININSSSTTGGDVNILTYDGVSAVVNRVDVNSATNGNITLTNNGTGWVQINSSNTGSLAQLKLQNTASSSTPCQVEYFMNKTTAGANNDNIANTFFYGKDVAGNKVEYGRIQATIRDATTNSTNGSIQVRLADNMTTGGSTTEYWRWNGADGQNESFKPLDMNTNDIVNIARVGLTNPTPSVGAFGQSLCSGGTATNALWNYKMAGYNVGTGGASTVDSSTFNDIFGNIPINLSTGSFMTSPTNKYKITVNGTFQGVNDICKFELQINSGTGGNVSGLTFGSGGLYYYAENVNIGGDYYTSYSFSDIFNTTTSPLTIGGICYVYCLVQTASGSHTISNNKHNVIIEPVYG